MKKGASFSDILKAATENKDAREKVFSEIVTKLFKYDKETLLMTSRLSQEMAYYIVKHIIVESFYHSYWIKIKVIKKAIHKSTYPFYEITNQPIYPEIQAYKINAYRDLILSILAITISYDGKGREEALSVIKSAEAKIIEQELRESQGMLGKFLK
jgi:hypothetical protein